ncbi:MAG TPA: methylenetetrahydrofolate reductase [NAD(P)H] [Candidatus Dormibacteraeota bacterium]|nr:methylenetetrahydrofolate reductase [NAD(P)H] [Candidatus Dormibacteraeota bacterium]
MKIAERLGAGSPCFSFEFFPPNTEKGVESLFRTVVDLGPLEPDFVSVTYPGSAQVMPDPEVLRKRRLTLELTRRIRAESGIEAMAHLTCSGHTRDELCDILDQLAAEGATNVLALRGDPPGGSGGAFVAVAGGFSHGVELVRLVRERGYDFCVGAACYPETHSEAPDAGVDLAHLVAKVDAGVDFLVTQLFFDNAHYFRFVDRARAAGIRVPIVPGLMPVTSAGTVARMPGFGASIPDDLRARLDACGDDAEAILAVGVAHTTEQAVGLLAGGAPGVHFYTLNTSRATRAIVSSLREQM